MYSASSRRFDVAAPSQSVTLCARKSHPDAIADRDVPLPNLPRKGLVFRFSTLVPRSLCPRIPHTSLHPCDFPVPRLISDHRSSFVRSVMGVPLLSGREHAHKKTGKKSSPLVLIRSLHLVLLLFLFSDWSKFSDFVPFRCPCNHLCLCFGRTCPCAVSEIFYVIPIR